MVFTMAIPTCRITHLTSIFPGSANAAAKLIKADKPEQKNNAQNILYLRATILLSSEVSL